MFSKKVVLLTLFIFIFFFIYYSLRILPSVFGADSGELLAVIKVLGVAHPPGYPLYTILGNLFLHIPFSTPAFRVGLLSALSGSLALSFIFLSAYTISRSYLASITTTLILGFSYTFGLYSQVTEAFSLNAFFVSFLSFLCLLLLTNKTYQRRTLFLFSFIFGLSLTHHHTILLMFPGFLYVFLKIQNKISKKDIIISTLLFILGLLPYLYLPLAARNLPSLNWGNPSNLPNLLKVIFRSSYGTFQSFGGNFPSVVERLVQIPTYFIFTLMDLTPVVIIFGIFGLFLLRNKPSLIIKFLSINLLFSGPLFFFYASFPLSQIFIVAILERFFIMSSIFIILLYSAGLNNCLQFIHSSKLYLLKSNMFKKILFLFIVLINLFTVFSLFAQNFNRLNLSNIFIGDNFAKDILRSVDRNSIVFLSGDMALFSSEYAYYNLNYRKDIKLIPLTRLTEDYIIKKLNKLYPDISFSKDVLKTHNLSLDIVKNNFSKLSIYSSEPLAIGKWYPVGFLYKYVDDSIIVDKNILKQEIITTLSSFNDVTSFNQIRNNTLFFSEIYEAYLTAYNQNIVYLLQEGFLEDAKKYLDYIFDTDVKAPQNISSIKKNYAVYYFKKNNCESAEKYTLDYSKDVKPYYEDLYKAYEFLESIAKDCYKDSKKEEIYRNLKNDVLKSSQTKLKEL